MSETPKPPPLDQWLVFELRCGTGPYWAVYWNTTDENSAHLHLPEGWDGRPRKMLHVSETDAAELADARTYRDAVRAAHNGYYAEMRDAMPELREPESPAAAISDLVQTAEEDGAMQERLRWEPELAALRAERDQLLASATSKEHRLHELRTERDDLKRKLDELKASIPTIWWEP
jgi:hypothetical protein